MDFTKSKWSFRAMESWEEILSVLKLERHVQDLASGRVDNLEAWSVNSSIGPFCVFKKSFKKPSDIEL